MSSQPVYATARERGGNLNVALPLRGESGGFEWIQYVGYFLAAVIVLWGVLFALLRWGVVGPRDWLYDNTKWIPLLGENSWARRTAGAGGV